VYNYLVNIRHNIIKKKKNPDKTKHHKNNNKNPIRCHIFLYFGIHEEICILMPHTGNVNTLFLPHILTKNLYTDNSSKEGNVCDSFLSSKRIIHLRDIIIYYYQDWDIRFLP